jgi:hypothetical protein
VQPAARRATAAGQRLRADRARGGAKGGHLLESVYVSRELNINVQDENYVINDYDFVECGEISVSEVLAKSDNTVFSCS